MSNCIEIHQHTVSFTEAEFDIDGFERVRVEHANCGPVPSVGALGQGEFDLFCWFLRDNSRARCADGKRMLEVRFGRGRSSHTWRDFRHTLWFLNSYVRKPKEHVFLVADEFDGFNGVSRVCVRWPYTSLEELWQASAD